MDGGLQGLAGMPVCFFLLKEAFVVSTSKMKPPVTFSFLVGATLREMIEADTCRSTVPSVRLATSCSPSTLTQRVGSP